MSPAPKFVVLFEHLRCFALLLRKRNFLATCYLLSCISGHLGILIILKNNLYY